MYIFILSKEHPTLPVMEIEELLGVKPIVKEGLLHIAHLSAHQFKKLSRLGFTKLVGKVVCSFDENKWETEISKVQWDSIVKGSFALEKEGSSKLPLKQIAGVIYDELKHPHVDLSHPQTVLTLISGGKKQYILYTVWKNPSNFAKRKPSLRPGFHPSSLDPKLARCMVNLANANTIHDPFCGTGGILIEAGLMGINYSGGDLDEQMIERSKLNLSHFKLKESVKKEDALVKSYGKAVVVSDIPYGRNTVMKSGLLKKFLEKYTGKKCVLGVSDLPHINKTIKNSAWSVKKDATVRLHKSLSKRILILERL